MQHLTKNTIRTLAVTLLVALLAALALGGCAGKRPTAKVHGFPKDAPAWVVNPSEDPRAAGSLAQYGSHRKTGAGFDFQRDQALLAARTKLAAEIEVRVGRAVDHAAAVTGALEADETVSAESRRYLREATEQSLLGAQQKDLWVNRDTGDVFVLVAVDAKVVENAIRQQKGLWDRFQSRLTREDLERIIQGAVPETGQARLP